MIEGIVWVIIAVIAFEYSSYHKKTGNTSIEGFLEYTNNKYNKKNTDPKEKQKKYEPRPGSDAHYAAWRAEQMKKNESRE